MSATAPQFKSRRVRLLLVGPALLLLSGCSKVSALGFPEGSSSINDISLPLWQGAWIAAGVVGVITLVLILWPAIFHRASAGKGEFPKQTQYNIPIELIYTIIPTIIVSIMFYFTYVKQNEITYKSPSVQHQISVNAIQWGWQFTYPQAGKLATVTGTPANPATLVLPQGERVRFTLNSSDVVHGFWIPAFMIQIQTLPGVTNYLEFTANKIGEFPGRCNILCGRNHSQMIFKVKVVTPAQYQSYLETLKASVA